MIRTILYCLKQSVIQMWRHKGRAFTTVFSITCTLLILALFFFLTVNITFATEALKAQFNTIEVFLLETTTQEDAEVMIKSLDHMEEVDKVDYITKDQAMEEFKVSWGSKGYLLDGLASNPLPNSLRVTLTDISQGDFVAQICREFSGVEEVRYYATEVNKILKISDALQKICVVIIVFLIVISIFGVYNTVKLNVMSRQDEIMIMRFVGATNWFIRAPMLLEGVLLGTIAAGISLLITNEGYKRCIEMFDEQVKVLFSTGLVPAPFMMENLTWIFLALGISIGSIGSIFAVRRFLRA